MLDALLKFIMKKKTGIRRKKRKTRRRHFQKIYKSTVMQI